MRIVSGKERRKLPERKETRWMESMLHRQGRARLFFPHLSAVRASIYKKTTGESLLLAQEKAP